MTDTLNPTADVVVPEACIAEACIPEACIIDVACLGPVQTIAWEEAKRAGITYAQIMGAQRAQRCVKPRHFAMWRASRETMATLTEIGRTFGGRDHATVIRAINKIDSQRSQASGCT